MPGKPDTVLKPEPIPPFRLRDADEKQLWIAVYAQNSDNDRVSTEEMGRWADEAVMELRQRLHNPKELAELLRQD